MCTACKPGAFGGQRRAPDPLDLEFQMAVSHSPVPGAEPGSLTGATSALNRCARLSSPVTGHFEVVLFVVPSLTLPHLHNPHRWAFLNYWVQIAYGRNTQNKPLPSFMSKRVKT